MGFFSFLANLFDSYVHLVNRFMGEDKGSWTTKDFMLLLTIFAFFIFTAFLFLYFLGVIKS